MTQLELSCQCGRVRGIAGPIRPGKGTRVKCYCRDCQAFARYLGQADRTLDPCGGSDLCVLPPSRVTLTRGSEHLRCLKLTPKGIHRWYSACCLTPIANTPSARLPFVGLNLGFVADAEQAKRSLGPIRFRAHRKDALARVPHDGQIAASKQGFLLKLLLKLLFWKLRGRCRPTPFYRDDGQPRITPISPAELAPGRPEVPAQKDEKP